MGKLFRLQKKANVDHLLGMQRKACQLPLSNPIFIAVSAPAAINPRNNELSTVAFGESALCILTDSVALPKPDTMPTK